MSINQPISKGHPTYWAVVLVNTMVHTTLYIQALYSVKSTPKVINKGSFVVLAFMMHVKQKYHFIKNLFVYFRCLRCFPVLFFISVYISNIFNNRNEAILSSGDKSQWITCHKIRCKKSNMAVFRITSWKWKTHWGWANFLLKYSTYVVEVSR